MSQEVRNLEPKALWNHFADLNEVPRPSKKEERVIAFIKGFGENLGLPTYVDEVGNVIIKKPATPGYENKTVIVLQSHLDMVHQKNADTDFDFDQEGIKMYIDGDWVRADGTTLGADNGLGVASIMTLLSSTAIEHPPLEALFTIDEETGMTGAQGLKGGLLDAKIMLNLDTEEDNELTIGCAGGIDVSIRNTYITHPISNNFKGYKLSVKGLKGGHSGMEIHLGRGNANKLMNRILWDLNQKVMLHIHEIDGGGLRNAIPRESFSSIAVKDDQVDELQSYIDEITSVLKTEHSTTDPDLEIILENTALATGFIPYDMQGPLLAAIYACPNGIYRMSPDIPELVQTSNNLARVLVQDGEITVLCLTRSAVNSEKLDLAEMIKATFSLTGAEISFDGSYPGWAPNPEADIIKIMSDLYWELFNDEPDVNACHAGLECGILGQNYPAMEMISFGPTIRGAHSPDERTQISSVQKYWSFLLETLKRIPENS